jgi:hypothetical protein
MPTSAMIKELANVRCQAWFNGFKSVKYIHISDSVSTDFPLWLISFWCDIHHICTTAHDL